MSGFFDDLPEPWEEEWQGMPEFVQEDKMPFRTIYVHFENQQDLEEFAELVDQRITSKTKFIWYPKAKIEELIKLRCVDSEEK